MIGPPLAHVLQVLAEWHLKLCIQQYPNLPLSSDTGPGIHSSILGDISKATQLPQSDFLAASSVVSQYFALSNHVGQSYGIEFRSFSKGFLYKDQDLRGASTEINFNDLK